MLVVLSGHGVWNLKTSERKPYFNVPAKCTLHFYTENFTLLTDDYGRELEQGRINLRSAREKIGPFRSAQNMILTWPRGLSVMKPLTNGWVQVIWKKGVQIPRDGRNIQFQIEEPAEPLTNVLKDPLGHLYLDEIFEILRPAIQVADEVAVVWAACRKNELEHVVPEQKYRFNRERVRLLIDWAEEDGITLTPALRTKLLGWHNRMMTIDELHRLVGIRDLVRSSTRPEKMFKRWQGAVGASGILSEREEGGLYDQLSTDHTGPAGLGLNSVARNENYVPKGFTGGRVIPHVPSKEGRPRMKK